MLIASRRETLVLLNRGKVYMFASQHPRRGAAEEFTGTGIKMHIVCAVIQLTVFCKSS
jgi:hypothetical protein